MPAGWVVFPARVCMRYVEDAEIPCGDFDNVSSGAFHKYRGEGVREGVRNAQLFVERSTRARYGTPTHWDMGKVYKRLALGIMRERACEPAGAIAEAFCSPVAPLIDDYNGSFLYEAPANILIARLMGAVE